MNRHLFAVVVMALVASCAGCTLGESHADIYGEKCRDGVAVYDNGVSVDFSSASVGDLEAREAGYCPDEFICSLNSEKEKICRRKCDENSYLCNEKCLSTDKYIFSHSKYEGLDYCEATLKCPENCKHGCDESLICKCADGCVNGCDETGACQCDKK